MTPLYDSGDHLRANTQSDHDSRLGRIDVDLACRSMYGYTVSKAGLRLEPALRIAYETAVVKFRRHAFHKE
jgi:hypothetical protein